MSEDLQSDSSEPEEVDNVQAIEVQESVLANMTDEQLRLVQERTAELIGNDENFNLCMAVMIASQQLYALARYSLQRECSKESITWQDGIEEMVIKAAKDYSTRPISRTDILRKVQGTVLKFLAEEVDIQLQDERADYLRQQKNLHEQRMQSPVQLTIMDISHSIRRGEVLVIWGELKSVEMTVLGGCQVSPVDYDMISFSSRPVREQLLHKSQLGTKSRVAIGLNRWSGAGSSPTSLRKIMETYGRQLRTGRPDVIRIANTPLLSTDKVVGRSRVRTANDAIQALLRFAEEHAAVVIAGLPLLGEDLHEFQDEVEKLLGPHYSLLRV